MAAGRNIRKAGHDEEPPGMQKAGHDDCYRIPEPEISKLYVGKLLDAGEKVDGVKRLTSINCYLK